MPTFGKHDSTRLYRDNARARLNGDASGGERGAEAGPEGVGEVSQNVRTSGQQREAQRSTIAARHGEVAPQPVLRRKQQFHAAGASADQHDVSRLSPQNACTQSLEPRQEAVDRLNRQSVFSGTRYRHGARARPDVDGDDVIGHRRAAPADHPPLHDVEADHLLLEEPCSGEARQRTRIDVHLVGSVMTGDVAWQHARVGRVDLARDQRQADTGQRLHAEAPQHGDMRVARTHKHHVLHHGTRVRSHARDPFTAIGATERRTGRSSIRNRRRKPRDSASIPSESNPVTAISTTAVSSRSSEIAASM